MIRRLALALAVGLPLAAAAQTPPPAPAAEPAPAPAPPPAPVTVDIGGWLLLNSYANLGGTNATDLPQRAASQRSDVATGMQVRQSRLRANLGLPGGGLLGDAKLKGLVEIDFMGGNAGAGTDQSLPLLRLRHAWASATWKDLGNLTLTLGQTWGLFEGPYFAASLGHLAVPRFAGAGFLFRRAPQARLSGEGGGESLAYQWAVALLAPMDRTNAAAPVTAATSVGERSGMLDIEARNAIVYRPGKKNVAELGVSLHLGQDRYVLGPPAATRNKTAASTGLSVDLKLDLPKVTILGAAYTGQNLDILNTITPGVKSTTVAASGAVPAYLSAVDSLETQGAWGQLQVAATPTVQLLLGGGYERPTHSKLPVSGTLVARNGQVSAGAVVALAPKWKCSAEYTQYVTTYNDAASSRYVANQLEVSTLYAF